MVKAGPTRDSHEQLVASYNMLPSPATQLFRALTCYPLTPVGVFPAQRAGIQLLVHHAEVLQQDSLNPTAF